MTKDVMKKLIKILFIILVAILFLAAMYFAWTYIRIQRGDLIKWDNKWYTQEQLREKFPPQEYDAPAKNTPEEIYAAFRQALLDDDIEGALGQITEEKREKYREVFGDKEKLENYKKVPGVDKIKKSEGETYGNFSSYYYSEFNNQNKEKVYYIEFIKDINGFWKIDQI